MSTGVFGFDIKVPRLPVGGDKVRGGKDADGFDKLLAGKAADKLPRDARPEGRLGGGAASPAPMPPRRADAPAEPPAPPSLAIRLKGALAERHPLPVPANDMAGDKRDVAVATDPARAEQVAVKDVKLPDDKGSPKDGFGGGEIDVANDDAPPETDAAGGRASEPAPLPERKQPVRNEDGKRQAADIAMDLASENTPPPAPAARDVPAARNVPLPVGRTLLAEGTASDAAIAADEPAEMTGATDRRARSQEHAAPMEEADPDGEPLAGKRAETVKTSEVRERTQPLPPAEARRNGDVATIMRAGNDKRGVERAETVSPARVATAPDALRTAGVEMAAAPTKPAVDAMARPTPRPLEKTDRTGEVSRPAVAGANAGTFRDGKATFADRTDAAGRSPLADEARQPPVEPKAAAQARPAAADAMRGATELGQVSAAPAGPAGQGTATASLLQAIGQNSNWARQMSELSGLRTDHASRIERGGETSHSLRIQLRPAELGSVTATMRLVGDRLSVSLNIEKETTLNALQRDQQAVHNALRSLGFQVDDLSINGTQVDRGGSEIAGQRSQADGNTQSGERRQAPFEDRGGNAPQAEAEARRESDDAASSGIYI